MKTLVLSYSFTGNNDALAKSVAINLDAEHIRVTEPRKRTQANIIVDLLLNRTPKIDMVPFCPQNYDMVLFMGPVWIGHPATPLRPYLKLIKAPKYAYASISGGADGPNPKLSEELEKLTGRAPDVVIDLHIADLLPVEPKPTRKVTMAYKINEEEIYKLAEAVVKAVRQVV